MVGTGAKALDKSAYGAIENSYFTNHYSTQNTSEKYKTLLNLIKLNTMKIHLSFSALGYDAAYIVKASIEKLVLQIKLLLKQWKI